MVPAVLKRSPGVLAPIAMMWRQMPTTEKIMVPAATARPRELDLEPAIRDRIDTDKQRSANAGSHYEMAAPTTQPER